MAQRRVGIGMALLAIVALAAAAGIVAARRADSGPDIRLAVSASSWPNVLAVDARSSRLFVPVSGGIAVLDMRTLAVVHTVPLGRNAGAAPLSLVADERTNRVIVIGYTSPFARYPRISVLNARSGALVHTLRTFVGPGVMALDERAGRIFVVGYNIGMLDARSGAPLPISPPAYGFSGVAIDARTGRAFVAHPDDDSVYVLDTHTGATVANSVVARSPHAVAVDAASGRVFVASSGVQTCPLANPRSCSLSGGGVDVLDARSGAVLRTLTPGTSPLVIAVDARTRRVFVLNSSIDPYGNPSGISSISVLDARSGALVRAIQVTANPNPVAIAVDERHGRVFITTQGPLARGGAPGRPVYGDVGHVIVLDARSGRMLRAIPAGVAPVAVAVDDRAGRAFILNAGGLVDLPDPWHWMPSWLRSRLPFLPPPGPRAHVAAPSLSVIDTTE